MNKFLVKLHRWVGFPVGILFVITFATGFLTSIDELAMRFNQGMTNDSPADSSTNTKLVSALTLQDNAQALAQVTQEKSVSQPRQNKRMITIVKTAIKSAHQHLKYSALNSSHLIVGLASHTVA